MSEDLNAWGLLRKLTWRHVLLVLAVLIVARLLSFVVRWVLRHAAEKASPHLRLSILRAIPIARLLIGIGAVVVAVPILVEPTFRNVVALLAGVGLALAFALKDYGKILESLRTYVSSNNGYWKVREVPSALRFQGWYDPDGKKSWDQNLK